MKLTDYLKAVVADIKSNATFLKDVGTHGRTMGASDIQRLMMTGPACRIALLGTRGGSRTTSSRSVTRSAVDTMGRSNTGEFRGPLSMAVFLIDQDRGVDDAQDRVVDLADRFMTYFENRTFGLKNVGPAVITGFEVLYDPTIADLGAAVAIIGYEQEVTFGRNLHLEDPAQIQPGWPIPPDASFTEQDWINVGLDPLTHAVPHAKARAKWPEGTDEVVDPETNPDHIPLDTEDNKESS